MILAAKKIADSRKPRTAFVNARLQISAASRPPTGFPKLKDTTLKTHAYITSITSNFGGKTHETPYIL